MSGRRIGEGPPALNMERIDWGSRDNAIDAPHAVAKASAEDFAGTERRTRQALHGYGGLRKAMAAFVIPRISEPAILNGDRRLVILQDLLPRLDPRAGTHALAAAVVKDEIARQRHLLSLLQQGIAA